MLQSYDNILYCVCFGVFVVIASCCREGKVVLSNARNGGVLDSIDQNLGSCCSVSLKGTGVKSRYLCLTDYSNDISIWDLKKKSRARKFSLPQGHAPTAFIDPTDTYVVAISSTQAGSIYLYHLRQGKLHHTYSPTTTTTTTPGVGSTCAHGSPLHHSLMAVGTTAGTVYLWDISQTHHTNYTTLTNTNTNTVAAVEFSPHHANVVVSCVGDHVQFYDTQQSNMIQSIKMDVESGGVVTCCGFSTLEPTLAVGTSSGNVHLYDLRQTSTSLSSLSLDANKITQMQFANTSSSSTKTTTATPKTPPPPPTTTTSISSNSSSTLKTAKTANNSTPVMEKKIPSILKSIQEQQDYDDEDETTKIPKIKSTMNTTNDTESMILTSKSFDKLLSSTTNTTSDKMDISNQNSVTSGIYKGPSPFPTSTKPTSVTTTKTLVKNLFESEKQPKEEVLPEQTVSSDYNYKIQSSYTDWKKSPERLQQADESEKEDEREEKLTPPTTNIAATRISEIMMISKV